MPVDIDQDIQAAVKGLWMQTPGLGVTDPASAAQYPPSGFVVGDLRTGRLAAGTGTDQKGQQAVYGHVEVVKGREGQSAGTAGAYYDRRDVTLTVRGLEPQVRAALGYMLTTFNLKNLLPTGVSGAQTLTMPSGARFFQWQPQDHGAKKIEEQQRGGAEIWQAQLKGEVTTIRTET